MGGSGGGSGGAIVQSTSPWAAAQAGQIGKAAADEAANYAQTATNAAMSSINQQYRDARYQVQPYQQAGVDALNKLNSYLGLGAYNPGNAPTAPTAPTLDSLGKKITDEEMRRYVVDNSTTNSMSPGPGQKQGYIYQGVRTSSPKGDILWGDLGPQEVLKPGSPYAQDIRNTLAQKQLPDAEQAYQDKLAQYNQDLTGYNQNKALYDKYTAAGPMTQSQITDTITNMPGYQAELGQGIDAIGKSASARGSLGSGGALKELMNFGQNTLSSYYGNELSRLAGIAGMGQQSATQSSNLYANQGSSLAQLQQQLGETKANAALAGGNALANAMVNANQNYEVMGQSSGGMGGLGTLLGGIGSLGGTGGIGSLASMFKP